MRFDVMTLFPDMVEGVLSESIIGRAQSAGIIEVKCHNIRDYSRDKHRKTDDTPYGGGMGMVMTCQPIYDCYRAIRDEIPEGNSSRVIYMSPKGRVFNHDIAKELSEYDNLIFLCGHYEGVDQRVLDEIVDEDMSIGDYVLTGGELAVEVICDAVIRLIPGVISDETSALSDSFQDNLLAAPVYTRPAEYNGWKVPEILLSGHEAKIRQWEFEQSLERTKLLRPDLLK